MNVRSFLNRRKRQSGLTVGVAFGADGVAAAAVRAGGRDTPPHLLHAAYQAHAGGDTGDWLAGWVEAHSLGRCRGVGVIADADYQVMQVEAPPVPATELRQAAGWRVRELIDFPLDQAVIDTFPPPDDAQRGQRNLNVVAARRSLVAERIRALEAAGLALEAIDIPELAQRNVSLRLPEARGGHALLALDDRDGLVTVYRDGQQYLARGLDTGRHALAESPEEAGENLLLEVQRSLDYFESALSQPPLGVLYVYPSGAEVDAVVDRFTDTLGNVELRGFGLADLLTVESDPPHDGAVTLHAVGAALRRAEKPA
jgi:MSHA biogenesis protein MshI